MENDSRDRPGQEPDVTPRGADGTFRLIPLPASRPRTGRPLSRQLEAFLLDRFSTKLEDPRTGRKVMPSRVRRAQ